ncbi:NAD(P)-dependent oxidoreductase [Rhodovibrio salinarum]|uniref:NAD(P)-dependent oxidoreductase n=2 Tax=Rhodovibrio salinarum TaxID=1087 RepID=A0A934QMC7_9PROT|nr:NAD(P)-dependent oxidoreductase [Rhodovibrio salinarum]
MTKQHVGFVGLGAMGRPMAENLLKAGFDVTVWNRSPDKMQALVDQGARKAERLAEVAKPHGIVLSMLADDAALEEVALGDGGLVEALSPGGLHVSMSTIHPETARKLADAHAEHEVGYLAAPVFGRPDMAAAGKLFVTWSGWHSYKERAQPVCAAFAQGFYDYGSDDVAAANVVKLAGNFMLASAMEAMGEAYAFCEQQGIAREQVNAQMTETLFACPAYKNYGDLIARHAYAPAGFTATLGLKDIGLALDAGRQAKVPMPLASLLRDRLLSLTARGHGDKDWSALGLAIAHDAGNDPTER